MYVHVYTSDVVKSIYTYIYIYSLLKYYMYGQDGCAARFC